LGDDGVEMERRWSGDGVGARGLSYYEMDLEVENVINNGWQTSYYVQLPGMNSLFYTILIFYLLLLASNF
jgi:hypothetical protein